MSERAARTHSSTFDRIRSIIRASLRVALISSSCLMLSIGEHTQTHTVGVTTAGHKIIAFSSQVSMISIWIFLLMMRVSVVHISGHNYHQWLNDVNNYQHQLITFIIFAVKTFPFDDSFHLCWSNWNVQLTLKWSLSLLVWWELKKTIETIKER